MTDIDFQVRATLADVPMEIADEWADGRNLTPIDADSTLMGLELPG